MKKLLSNKNKQLKIISATFLSILSILLASQLTNAQMVSPTIVVAPINIIVTTQQLINNEAKYFNEATNLTINKTLDGNISSNPDKLYTLFTVDSQGNPSVVKAYVGNLYVNISNPNENIQIYTTSKSIEGKIMAGISGATSRFTSITGIVKKIELQGGYYYYAFEITNVQLQPR